MSQLGGPTMQIALPVAAQQASSCDAFLAALRPEVKTDNVNEQTIQARLLRSNVLCRWVAGAQWPTNDVTELNKIASVLYDYRGRRFCGEIQYAGVTFMCRDDIDHNWRVGDAVPGGYLLDCVQLDDQFVMARVQIVPGLPPQ